MKSVDLALGAITRILIVVAGLAALAMMSLVVLDVTLRYMTSQPLQGTLEIASYYFMAPLVLFSFPFVERQQRHVRISLVTDLLSDRLQRILTVATGFLSCAYLAFFAFKAGEEAIKKTGIGEVAPSLTFDVYIWAARWTVPIGIGLMAVMLLVDTLRHIADSSEEKLK